MVGHGHAGKTTLVSAMLYTAGATQRLGRVDDGSATTDHDEEEIARKMSISTGAAVVEWGTSSGTTKINILDTPGFSMFVHEAKMVLPVVDAAIVVVDGVAGVEVGMEFWVEFLLAIRVLQKYVKDYASPSGRVDRWNGSMQ